MSHRRARHARRVTGCLGPSVGWCVGPQRPCSSRRALARRLFRLRVEGDHRLPARGPAIIAANHLSLFDHVALGLSVRRRLTFVGKAEYLESWKT